MPLDFPSSPAVNDLFTASGKTWKWNGTFWELVLSGPQIADGSVSTAKLADGAITAAKIADGTIVAAEIANNAITTDKIAAGAVTAAKLGNDIQLTPPDGSITTAKVAANAITQAKLSASLSAVTVTTSANRDTVVPSPFTGQLVFLTDTKKVQVWDGSAWLNITLAPPEPPTSLSATALGNTSIAVAFTAGGANGSPITNYKYALSTNGGASYGAFTALDPADALTPITISGLTGGITYHIKLKAVNDMGDSAESSATSTTTLVVPDAPTNLSASNITETTVDISFTAGADNGYAITNYQYALSTNGGSTYSTFTALNPADTTSPITITGLTANTSYHIKLKAVNSAGAGPESAAVAIVAADVLLIAGGGSGGGGHYGGGGGAGGARTFASKLGITSVIVGGGGTGGAAGERGGNGNNSSYVAIGTTYSSSGGGGGAGAYSTTNPGGGSGGSGGGGSLYQDNHLPGSGNAGSYTPAEGYAGGRGSSYSNAANSSGGGGGGGGATGSGEDVYGNAGRGGFGGIGITSTATGSSVKYAGGGGGATWIGSQESGIYADYGGGRGAFSDTAPTNGATNKGAGGGGARSYVSGANGGSGVVILRYLNFYTITVGAGLTASPVNADAGSGYKYTIFTAGSGNVSWS